MSSREIADLVESRHADVVRSIQRLIDAGVIQGYAPTAYTHPQNGQTYECFMLNKRDSYVVVAQLSPQFTARLVDRWQELESQQAPAIPRSFAEALRLVSGCPCPLSYKRPERNRRKPPGLNAAQAGAFYGAALQPPNKGWWPNGNNTGPFLT